MHPSIEYEAAGAFRTYLARCGRNVVPLREVLVNYRAHYDELIFRAEFVDGSDWAWTMPMRRLGGSPPPFGRDALRRIDRELRSLYSRLFEDHLMRLELEPRMEALRVLELTDAPPDVLWRARREMEQFEGHVRQHHEQTPVSFVGVDYGREEPTYVTSAGPAATTTLETIRRAMERMAVSPDMLHTYRSESFAEYARANIFTGTPLLDPAAEKKGMALLKSWLTPEQLASYESQSHFEVIGSDSGKRYRIRQGRQMNIDELDGKGRKVCGWCFLPEGGLVAGDCMLAQKIALETNETAALKVANKFGGGIADQLFHAMFGGPVVMPTVGV